MKKLLVVLIAVLSIGAVLAFTYFAPSTGMQGFIRKKGGSGGEELVRKNFDVTTNSRTSSRGQDVNISCADSYSIVDQKLNEIKNANTKINSAYPVFSGTEMSSVSDAYANSMNDLDTAISNYKTAYENYKNKGCKNDVCNNTIQTVNDTAAALYFDYGKTYELYIVIKTYKEEWSQKYDFQYKKLKANLDQQISTKEKNKINAEINALNSNPEIQALQKKLNDLETERKTQEKKLQTSTTNSKNAIKNFNTQCKK